MAQMSKRRAEEVIDIGNGISGSRNLIMILGLKDRHLFPIYMSLWLR